MIFFGEPNEAAVRTSLNDYSRQPFSFSQPGLTREMGRAAGFRSDHFRAHLGDGREIFDKARIALGNWRMFRLDWIRHCWPYVKLAGGNLFGVLAFHYGFWSLNPLKIVYVIDEDNRYGFAGATLAGHMLRGEERFLIELDQDGRVWFDIYALSRPRHWMAWAFYPIVRMLQSEFQSDAANSMMDAVCQVTTAR